MYSSSVITRTNRCQPRGALVVSLLALLACDDSFVAIEESDRVFSVFGYLDPSADTQWIRVMETRPVLVTTAEPVGAAVTLEEEGTGRRIVLRDSIMEFVHNITVGAPGVFVHNYWTAEKIRAGATYRFTALSRDGYSTTATVRIPSDYAAVVALNPSPSPHSFYEEARVSGVPHLAFVEVQAHLTGCPNLPWNHPQRIRAEIPGRSSDPHTVRTRKLSGSTACGPADSLNLWIVGTIDPWPKGAQFGATAVGAANLPTNLKNGTGFLGGVLTKVIPYEDCILAGPAPLPQYCVLSYDSLKATVRGTVRESCRNRPLTSAELRLEPLPNDPREVKKIRMARSASEGSFRFAALDPGVRYALNVSHPSRTTPFQGNRPIYAEHTDTLVFPPAGRLTLDVQLQQVESCE